MTPTGVGPDVRLDLSADPVALTVSLVDVASVSGAEQPLADGIEAALRTLRHLSVTRHGNVVVARTDLGRRRRVLLAGHIDTVPVAGNLPSRVEAGRLYGCGATDMKAGVAAQLALAAAVTEPVVDVTYVCYDCEEVAADRNGLRALAAARPELLAGDFAVLLEPTGGVVEGGCQGTMRAEVAAAGRRAHSARSWMGRNAIHEAAGILDTLRGYRPRQPIVDGLRYREGLNAVGIAGGIAGNVIPDTCVVTVNYRFAPDRDVATAEEHLREVFGRWTVTVTDAAPSAHPGLDHPVAAAFLAAVGGQPRAKLGWTDVARFAALGVPAVNYGPGIPELAHTSGEYVETTAITECTERMRRWLTGDAPSPGRRR